MANPRFGIQLVIAALLAGTASCGSDQGGGKDAVSGDGGKDVTVVDVHFDLMPPVDLYVDKGSEAASDVPPEAVADPGGEAPPVVPAPDAAGQMLVTEFMAKSQPGAGDKGEWVELFNATAGPLDLGGCEFGDDGSDGHVIASHLIVEGGAFVVMSRTDDTVLNHGLAPDYLYNDFILSNDTDSIVLTCGQEEIDRVEYTADWVIEGVAIQLGSTAFDATKNDLFESWCAATIEYGSDAKLGTPGEPNLECVPPDPCDPNPCTEPPPPECDADGVTLITYGSTADCIDMQGVAECGEYPAQGNDCSLADMVCEEGACVEPPIPQPGAAGEIVITEFMPKSGPGIDAGEWIEILNPGAGVLDLGGCVLGDDGNDSHEIAGPLLVEGGSYAILAKSDDGYVADYQYSGFQMVNDGDKIVLTCGATEIDRVEYTLGWVQEGYAAQLSGDTLDADSNDDGANWCAATATYGDAGKYGTPGLPNGTCADPCEPNPCTAYPAPECELDDVTLHTYDTPAPCVLVFGATSCGDYPVTATDCSIDFKVCIDGACTDPCDPNPCTDFPAPACEADGVTLTKWETPAPCTLDGTSPVCGEYPGTPVDCSLDAKICFEGDCAPDPCIPNPCTEYPAAECGVDGVTLTKWETPAPCSNEGLDPVCGSYDSTEIDCSLDGKLCLEGACVQDPCDPNPCTVFPAPACKADGVTLLTYSTPATCAISGTGSVCGDYPATPVDCTLDGKVCVGGQCVDDPCDPNPCTEPPGPECDVDGVTLTTWTSPAPCTNDGTSPVCGAYPSISVNCSDSGKVCLSGACVEDFCDPNPCTEPPPPECDADGVTLTTWTSPAPCTNDGSQAVCGDYPSATTDCGTEQKLCVDGGCLAVPVPETAGDVVFTEFMVRSQSGTDPGEWVEIVNATDHLLDLGGCELKDDGTNSHIIAGHLLMASGATLLLAREDDGYAADYHYTNFFLSNEPDEIVLKCGETEIDRVNYTDTWYSLGVSTQLDPDKIDAAANDDFANWCAGTVEYGEAGKMGTPGAPNLECPGPPVGWCRLQWPLDPPDATQVAGVDLTIYGRVFFDGVTNVSTGVDEDPELIGQVGYGPDGSGPDGNPDWTWVTAGGNPAWVDTEEPGNDEYMGAVNVPTPGTYDHAYRFSADGGATWTYCDRKVDVNSDGSKDGYQIVAAGNLVITAQ